MTIMNTLGGTTRRATVLRPAKRRGGFGDFNCGNRRDMAKRDGRNSNDSGSTAERPDFLGLPGAARHVTRTAEGYAAGVSDMFGNRRAVGIFADAATALAAARTAFAETAGNV